MFSQIMNSFIASRETKGGSSNNATTERLRPQVQSNGSSNGQTVNTSGSSPNLSPIVSPIATRSNVSTNNVEKTEESQTKQHTVTDPDSPNPKMNGQGKHMSY